MKKLIYIAISILLAMMNLQAENIDPDNDNSQYSYSETSGWFNFEATNGGATVTSSNVTGWIWCENLGWLQLHHNYGWITNDGVGNLSGYAYGETSGWINFNPVNGGVAIDPATGDFSGWAYGENIGWVRFNEISPVIYKVKTAWKMSPPLAPSNLTATAISTNQINLSWNDVANETSYTLFRNESNNTNSALPLMGFSSNQTNHSDTGLSSDTTYYYWVKAYNSFGASGFSTAASGKTFSALPATPVFTDISTAITNQITLTWDDLPNETSYTLFRNTVNNSSSAINIAGLAANVITYADRAVASGNTYYYWLRAYNQYGASGLSFPTSIKITNAIPNAPTGSFTPFSNIVISNIKVTFNWPDGTDLNDSPANLSYILRVDDDGEITGSYDFQVTSTTGTSTYADLELPDNKYYTWAVKTIDDEGAESGWSKLQNFFLISKRLEQPKWDEVEVDGLDIKLKWKKSTEPQFVGYNVYWSMQKGIYTNKIDVKKENEYIMQDLEYDIAYFISLSGYDIADRESKKAEEKEITIKDWVKGEKSILYNSIVKPDEDMKMELMIKMEVDGDVEIKIYSRSHRPIVRWKEHYKKGIRVKTWDLKDNGKTLSSGVYYIVIRTSRWKKTILLCVVK